MSRQIKRLLISLKDLSGLTDLVYSVFAILSRAVYWGNLDLDFRV